MKIKTTKKSLTKVEYVLSEEEIDILNQSLDILCNISCAYQEKDIEEPILEVNEDEYFDVEEMEDIRGLFEDLLYVLINRGKGKFSIYEQSELLEEN